VRRRGLALAALLLAIPLVVPGTAGAHGIGGIKDLPVPGWLFLVGGATVLVVSFVALGALWKQPKLQEGAGDPAPPALQRVLLSPWTRRVVQALSLALFAVLWSAAAFGTERASENLTPTFVYVVFWVGMVIVTIVLGNVWTVLNPWRAAADLVAWVGARLGWSRQPRPYPEGLGLWPAAVLLCSFTVLELVWADPAVPDTLAEAILVYSVSTWTGMLVFGRKAWLENGDGFSVYFGFLSRAALFGTRERSDGRREIILRKPLSALAHVERRPGAVAFFAVMLGTVAFDGLSRSTWWLNRLYDLETRFADPKDAEHAVELLNLSGLVLAVVLVATLYTLAVKAAEGVVGEQVDFRGVFVCSLVPIAIVYALSHYFSLLVIQGQFAIPLISDPYGKGWDLFGTVDFEPNLSILTPNLVWYVQVSVLVLGHVAGLIVAHDRAVALSPSPKIALRTQYAMLTLMVLFTVGGMWLLSIG
jgi:hypothetical protein